jgi:IS30 family transposase
MAEHLTSQERDGIAQLHHQGYPQCRIAAELNRSPATISRELRRNATGGSYHAAQAQRRAERRRQERPLVRMMDRPDTSEFVRHGLANCWSPDQIAGRLRRVHPDEPERHLAPQTIYSWIAAQEREMRDHWRGFLRRRGRRARRKPENLEQVASHAAIANRPVAINERRRLGDLEGDTVLGPPGTGGVVTLVDRRSRYTIITKTKTKNARRVRQRIQLRLDRLAPQQRRSITFDNGTEFARCHLLERRLGLRVYFAQPGRPYQRGTNENTNGLIRQYFPKGTDFRGISHVAVADVENRLNDRPRACLGYSTPREVFFEKHPPAGCD